MSNVFSRTCALFAVAGALGMTACASPSRPSAIPSAGAVPSGLTAITPWSYGRDACECWLDLYNPPHPLPHYNLRTSRLGLSSDSAHSQ